MKITNLRGNQNQNLNNRGFTVLELLVSLIAITLLSVAVFKVGSVFYDIVSRQRDIAKGERIRDGIYRYYVEFYQYINSTQTGNNLLLPNGCNLTTETNFVPRYRQDRVCGVAGLKYFDEEPYDSKMSNYRIVITPLLDNGKFHYRKIHVVYVKGRRGQMLSSVNNATGDIVCHPSEVCWTIDGEKITITKYEEMIKKVSDIVSRLQAYATAKYSADATKNLLMYYFANASTGGTNSSNCSNGNKLCYFSASSEIRNSCVANPTVPVIRGPRGVVYYVISGIDTSCLSLGQNISQRIFGGTTDIYIDNGSANIRNPETVNDNDLGGYTARVIGCISDVDCIQQIAYQ